MADKQENLKNAIENFKENLLLLRKWIKNNDRLVFDSLDGHIPQLKIILFFMTGDKSYIDTDTVGDLLETYYPALKNLSKFQKFGNIIESELFSELENLIITPSEAILECL